MNVVYVTKFVRVKKLPRSERSKITEEEVLFMMWVLSPMLKKVKLFASKRKKETSS